MEKPPSVEAPIDILINKAAQEVAGAQGSDLERSKRLVDRTVGLIRSAIRHYSERLDHLTTYYHDRLSRVGDIPEARQTMEEVYKEMKDSLKQSHDEIVAELLLVPQEFGVSEGVARQLLEEIRTQEEKVVPIPSVKR